MESLKGATWNTSAIYDIASAATILGECKWDTMCVQAVHDDWYECLCHGYKFFISSKPGINGRRTAVAVKEHRGSEHEDRVGGIIQVHFRWDGKSFTVISAYLSAQWPH